MGNSIKAGQHGKSKNDEREEKIRRICECLAVEPQEFIALMREPKWPPLATRKGSGPRDDSV